VVADWVIGSTSGGFNQFNGQPSGMFWIGDKACGWSGCDYTAINSIKEGKNTPLQVIESFCGIPNSHDLVGGDTIELCGIASYDSLEESVEFGFFLSYFDCSEDISETGAFTVYNLFEGTAYWDGYKVCFNGFLELTDDLPACNINWIVGMRGSSPSVEPDYPVRFSYSLHAYRNCT
jgi:hypothetical protein